MIVRLIISLTVGALITTLIIRSLNVENYGVYTVLYSLIGYVSVVGSFGIPAVFQRFIPEAFQRKEFALVKQLVLKGLILRLVFSGITVAVILALHGPIGRLLKLDDFYRYFVVFSWGILLSLEATLLTSVLHSLFLHRYSVIASTIYTVFRGISVLVLLKCGFGIQGVLWAEVASWGVWLTLQFLSYHMAFARFHRSKESPPVPLKRFVRYGFISSFNEMGTTVLGVSTDFFVISAILGPAAVAFYAFADRVVRLSLQCMPHSFLVDVIRPSFFAKYAETGNDQHLADMFNLLLKIGAFTVFPLTAGVFVLGDKLIVYIFKADYLPALPILWVLMCFTSINIFVQPTGLVIRAIEQVQIFLYSTVFAVYNLVVELFVIRQFGVMGVVLVTCSAVFMKNIFLYLGMRRHVRFPVDWRGLFIIATNSALMMMVIYPLRPYISSPARLAFVAILGGLVYLLSAWVNKSFTLRERGWINRVAPRPIFVF